MMKQLIKHLMMWMSSMIYSNHKSKLLYYHDICHGEGYRSLDSGDVMGTDIELFKKHIEVIRKEGYKIVRNISNPDGEVAILLDDGFRGIWENRQYFYDNKIYPTIFLPVDYIGKTDKGILNEYEIRELQANGFVFECHSWTHDELTHKTNEELKKELCESKAYLSKLLSKKISGLCLPLGFFSNHLLDELKKYDYTEVYSCIPGNFEDKVFGMRRRNLCQFATPWEVKMILRGGLAILAGHYIKLHHKK